MLKWFIHSIIFCFFCFNTLAQNTPKDLKIEKKDSTFVVVDEIDILAPSKAAFYSAVFPGLGQAYNKKYWKVPFVWAAVGTGIYFYVDNNNEYNRFRDAFKLRESGRPDEFDGVTGDSPFQSDATLRRAQDVLKKNRDLALFATIGLYILNIVEANVDAHLPDKALDTNISFNPGVFTSPVTTQAMFGGTLTFNF